MKAMNSLSKQGGMPRNVPFEEAVRGAAIQKKITSTLGGRAGQRFTATLISAVTASEQLQECAPTTIVNAALKGEGMGLIYGIGFYVVPYKKTATFVLGYKGVIQLCLATGLYADIDCVDVREGEHLGRNRRTGKPNIDFSVYETDEERETHPVIGYKAYFELKDGYYKEEYWSVDQLLQHADRYSQAFSYDLYTKWQNGEQLDKKELYTIENGSPWYDVGGKQETMMKKTVLRSLLLSGYAPMNNEARTTIEADGNGGDGYLPVIDGMPTEPPQVVQTENYAEREETAAEEQPEPARGADKPGEENADEEEDDFTKGFFD